MVLKRIGEGFRIGGAAYKGLFTGKGLSNATELQKKFTKEEEKTKKKEKLKTKRKAGLMGSGKTARRNRVKARNAEILRKRREKAKNKNK